MLVIRDAEKSLIIHCRTMQRELGVPVLTEDAGKCRDGIGKPTAFNHIIDTTAITTAIESISSSDARTERMSSLQTH